MTPIRIRNLSLKFILKTIVFLLIGGVAIWYVNFQARSFIDGPQLALITPTETIQNKQNIVISGTAANITAITLNGRVIHTDENGVFAEKLVLENGYTIMTLSAKDRFGRSTSLTKEFIYAPGKSIN